MHEIPLLINIGVALAAALVGGLLARRARVPPIVGYLVAGMTIGPFTPGFVGDLDTISQLAELGVIFLMFGVGLHFSLRDLWRVRGVAIPGALGQMAITTALGYGVGRWWGWSGEASIVLGLAISIASTVVLLRSLMDEGLLDSRHGRIAVGWLVLEDLATVLLLLILPALASGPTGVASPPLGFTLLKAAVFVALMLLLGARVVPWVLLRIARMQSRELFLLVALTLSLGIALTAATLFGVSIALGAFLAGVVVAESPLSHQVGADVLPFREAFAVLFFVSVGMLVDPRDLVAHAGHVALLTTLIVVGKGLAALTLTLLLRQPALTALVVAAGLAQIGEFSFILGQSAVRLRMLSDAQYSLVLAAALLSITLNPLLFKLVPRLERTIGARLGARPSLEASIAPTLRDHVVVVGAGRVGSHIVDVLGRMGIPRLVVESDAATVEDLQKAGVPVLYGDAGNSEILDHAGLGRARALVVTIPDDPADPASPWPRRGRSRLPCPSWPAPPRRRESASSRSSGRTTSSIRSWKGVSSCSATRCCTSASPCARCSATHRSCAARATRRVRTATPSTRPCTRWWTRPGTSTSPGCACPRTALLPATRWPKWTSARARALRWWRCIATDRWCRARRRTSSSRPATGWA
jgi:CPA2 family monovalent cation:H+ antiporter-2